jgi:hypothetical protein
MLVATGDQAALGMIAFGKTHGVADVGVQLEV